MNRSVSTVLVRPPGVILGALPAIELACPHWPEAADLVTALAERFDVEVVVLRLLNTDRPSPPGGHVVVLAELRPDSRTPLGELVPVSEELARRALTPHPKRMPWAEVGGPGESVAWARRELPVQLGELIAVQQRTWNLSTLWRFETADRRHTRAWLKQVPRFLRYEGRLLRWLGAAAPGTTPEIIAEDGAGRMLLAHVEGDDFYGAPAPVRSAIAERLHTIQLASIDALNTLIGLGVSDRRGPKLAAFVREVLATASNRIPQTEALLRELDARLAELEACNLPATLLHGDNHPGNARGHAGDVKLVDWGEAVIGNPAQDIVGLVADLSEADAAPVLAEWCRRWRDCAPRSNPERAIELYPFVSAMTGAAIYAHFLSEIEPSEAPYHASDVPRCLEAAARFLRA